MRLDASVNAAINENSIDSTVNELGNLIDDITNDLNSMDMIFYNMNDYFKSNQSDEFVAKFNSFRKNFELIRENLGTFTSDLIKVKNGTADLMALEAIRFNDLADEKTLQAKKINVEN